MERAYEDHVWKKATSNSEMVDTGLRERVFHWNAEIVAGVRRREPSIDFQTADEASLRRLREPEVLALAAQENRILITHDRRTMPRHFAVFILHHSSPGVFIIAQAASVRMAIEELLLVWAASASAEWRNLIIELPL